MATTHKIADAVGRVKMAKALNVGATAISNAVVAGKFPASWFRVMEILCRDAGIKCDPSLFGMKSTVGVIRVNELPTIQGSDQQKVNEARS